MGWLRLVGSLKVQVSFAEYSLFYRALLQKRPIILRSLLIVANTYHFPQILTFFCSSSFVLTVFNTHLFFYFSFSFSPLIPTFLSFPHCFFFPSFSSPLILIFFQFQPFLLALMAHCNTLQSTATQDHPLQHTATHNNLYCLRSFRELGHATATHYNSL